MNLTEIFFFSGRTRNHRSDRYTRRPIRSRHLSRNKGSASPSSHSPRIAAVRTFPPADHIFIDELADSIAGDGSTCGTHKDPEESTDAGEQQTSHNRSGMGSGCGGNVTARTGPEERCRTTNSIGRISPPSATGTVHDSASLTTTPTREKPHRPSFLPERSPVPAPPPPR